MAANSNTLVKILYGTLLRQTRNYQRELVRAKPVVDLQNELQPLLEVLPPQDKHLVAELSFLQLQNQPQALSTVATTIFKRNAFLTDKQVVNNKIDVGLQALLSINRRIKLLKKHTFAAYSSATTNDIIVEVVSRRRQYLSAMVQGGGGGSGLAVKPEPEYIYDVKITNTTTNKTVQLLRRKWVVVQSDGSETVVEGEGVIGKKPVLEPGKSHSYSSSVRISGTYATMFGAYTMLDLETSSLFDIKIAPFGLL